MLLSIVIPTYNMASWLPVALESCLWQTRGDFEVIVVDDGSTDAGPDIARAYARLDPRFRVISQANAGLGSARQAGQDAARGDFITWLDADDFLAPEAVAAWLAEAGRGGADMVCGNAVAFSGRTFHAWRLACHPPAGGLTFDHNPEYWLSRNVWRWIISLSFIRRHGLTHPRYARGQDACFMYAALARAKHFAQCAPCVYYWRQEHKGALPVQVWVEQLAHYSHVRDSLLHPPDGVPRYKPLVNYLNKVYWRNNVRALAPRCAGADAACLDRVIELGLELFAGLDPAWFRAEALAPEAREETAFLPLADALIAGDAVAARAVLERLRDAPRRKTDKTTPFHTLRRKIKTLFNPLSRSAKAYLRELERRAARRCAGTGAA